MFNEPDTYECDDCDTVFESFIDYHDHDCDVLRHLGDGWVVQQGLGSRDAQGQTTLDGGVKPEGGDAT